VAEFPAHLFRMDGDPGAVRASAGKWSTFGAAATDASAQITGLDTAEFVGPEGDMFREGLNADMPRHLSITGDAFGRVARALTSFADALGSLQDRMRPLTARAPGLWEAVHAAQGRVDMAVTADAQHERDVANQPEGDTSPDTYRSDSAAAGSALSAARAEWDACVSAASGLRGELTAAVDHAVRAINTAKDMRFKENPKWWDIGGQFTNFVRDNRELLAKLSGALKIVSLVAGLLSFIPMLAPIMAPIALGTALLAGAIDLSIYAATGQGSLKTILIDVGLNLLPGVGKLARMGAGALRGTRVAQAFSGSMRGLGAIRSSISSLRSSAVALGRRFVRIDPIDVVTGEMVMTHTDIELPGVLPLVLRRTHLSSYRAGVWFGRSWVSTLDQRLEVDADGVCYASADGMLLVFPTPKDGGEPVTPVEGPRLLLSRAGDRYTVEDPLAGRMVTFADLPGIRVGEVTILRPRALTDRNGNRIEVDHDAEGAPVLVRHSGGYRVAVDTHAGRVSALRVLAADAADTADADLPAVRFGYDDLGDLVEVVNSSGRPLRLDYDPFGRLTAWTDRNGVSYGYRYDEAGRCVQTTGPGGVLSSTLVYDTDTRTTTVTDSLGHATTFHLNSHLQVEREVDPLGNTTGRRWDRYDRKLAETDPLGRTTSYRYDDAGNLVACTRPDGSAITIEYDGARLPVTVVDYDGGVWRREYDPRGNLTAITDPADGVHRFGYDDRGAATTAVDPLGATTTIETDTAGLPVTVTDPAGATTAYRRDPAGRVTAVTDPAGGVTRYRYTREGNLRARIGPHGATDQWSYDPEGNVVAHTTAAGATTRYEIGPFDRPVAQIDPDSARLEFSYDTELRLATVTNPYGRQWCYEYDPAGQLIAETDFNNRTISYGYDPAGQLTTRTSAAGTTSYTRDLLGRTIQAEDPDGVTRYRFDPHGRLVQATNDDADVRLDRDQLGRVVAETCNGHTIASRYDPTGRRTWRRTPAGVQSTWTYNPAGQPTQLTTAGQQLRFGYDHAGRETERTFGDAATLTHTWDAHHRLTGQTLTTATGPALQRAYTYRPDGLLTAVADNGTGTDRRFDLDPAGRVTAVHTGGHGWQERYAYNQAGAPTAATWPGSDELTVGGEREYDGTVVRHAGHTSYEHDTDGRIVHRHHRPPSGRASSWRFTWTAQDRLATVTGPDGTRWRYRYDPLGRRIAKQQLDQHNHVIDETRFVWDGLTLAEQDHDGDATTWEWQPGTFTPIAQIDGSASTDIDQQFYAIIADLTGAPTALVDHTGVVAWQADHTLWGITRTTASAGTDCPLRFSGQYHDPETDLHYNLHRYYDPATGRYQSPDPLGLAPGPDPHGYVTTPTIEVDPFGLVNCDPRNLPGVATGSAGLRDITGRWLRGSHGNAGRFPGQIARQLEGQTFNTFDDFREAFWRAAAGDPHLTSQFGAANITRMQQGLAPIAHTSQQVGGNVSYVLHHLTPIQHGGGVYDMANLAVMTPRFHLDVLARTFHF